MPSRVDVAAQAAQEEIANAVRRIENSSPSRLDPDVSSPLFRDELQQHEIRHLDHPLALERPAADADTNAFRKGRSQSEGGGRGDGNPRILLAGSRLSNLAFALNPYAYDDYTDDDRKKNSGPRSAAMASASTQTHHATKPDPNQNERAGTHRFSEKAAHINQMRKSKTAITAMPSRNRRRPMNRKWIRRAQLASRKVVAKIVRMGRHCTQQVGALEHAIRRGVARAAAAAHSLLGDAPFPHGAASAEEGGAAVRAHGPTGAGKGLRPAHPGPTGGGAAAAPRRDPSSTRVPPDNMFAFAPSWMSAWDGRKKTSSKAISMIKSRIRN